MFWAWFWPVGPRFRPPFFLFFFFPPLKNLALSLTRYHGELLSCNISEKTNEPIFRKCSDWQTHWWMEGLMDGQMDDSDLIGLSPTNAECQTKYNIFQTVLRGPHSYNGLRTKLERYNTSVFLRYYATSIFEEHKICLNCTKSLLIMYYSSINTQNNEDLWCTSVSLFNFTLLSTILLFTSLNKTPLKSLKIYF